MSKPSTQPTRYVRKPRLKAGPLAILANESKGKITGFVVTYTDKEPREFPVVNNKILPAFQAAQVYADQLLQTKTITHAQSKSSDKTKRRKISG